MKLSEADLYIKLSDILEEEEGKTIIIMDTEGNTIGLHSRN